VAVESAGMKPALECERTTDERDTCGVMQGHGAEEHQW
jgi:hypothetical protein